MNESLLVKQFSEIYYQNASEAELPPAGREARARRHLQLLQRLLREPLVEVSADEANPQRAQLMLVTPDRPFLIDSLRMDLDEQGALEIAHRSRGTPRIANRLLRRVRDYAEVKHTGSITAPIADAALSMLDVDKIGLDMMDRKFLEAVLHKFSGGPVGLDNIAAAIGESTDTIEDVIEPYLIQQGFLQRTPRGRMATTSAFAHFGLTPPE